jgi:nucleotide-binding universal stress UspA family protein
MECEENVQHEILKSQHGKKTSDIIRDQLMSWTNEKFIDYIYVGNKGADFSSRNEKNYLGSVTAEVIKHTKLNVFFIP